MMQSSLFREKAIKRISSPDQLDKLVRIVSPRVWIALLALIAVAGGAIVWAVVATVPTTVKAIGYYLPEGGLRKIVAPVPGLLKGVEFADGQHVIAGQVLGEIEEQGGQVAKILAPETGVVMEANAAAGIYVASGGDLGEIVPVGWPLVVYSYLPAEQAGSLFPGVPVHVRFGAGIGSVFGYAVGKVILASDFPVSHAHLVNVLQVGSVVRRVEKEGPVGEVVVGLSLSAVTPSGLTWGSGNGPPGPVPAGIGAKVSFIVGSHHPIDDVI